MALLLLLIITRFRYFFSENDMSNHKGISEHNSLVYSWKADVKFYEMNVASSMFCYENIHGAIHRAITAFL